MAAEEAPPLGADTWEEIKLRTYEVQKNFATRLKPFTVDEPSLFAALALAGSGDGLPPPPKRPIAVGKILGEYAMKLFDAESAFYPPGERLPTWLQVLAVKVERDVVLHAMRIGRPRGIGAAISAMQPQGVAYHISETEMREAIRAALKTRVGKQLQSSPIPQLTPKVAEILAPSSRITKVEETRIQLAPKKKRMPVTVSSLLAARRMESFLAAKGVGQTEFATVLGITDRTLRAFRRTGRIKRETFNKIAIEMGTTREKLMDPNDQVFR